MNIQLVPACSATIPLLNDVFDFSVACCSENRDAKNDRDTRTVFVTQGHFFSSFYVLGFLGR